jgi:hypothetical protein
VATHLTAVLGEVEVDDLLAADVELAGATEVLELTALDERAERVKEPDGVLGRFIAGACRRGVLSGDPEVPVRTDPDAAVIGPSQHLRPVVGLSRLPVPVVVVVAAGLVALVPFTFAPVDRCDLGTHVPIVAAATTRIVDEEHVRPVGLGCRHVGRPPVPLEIARRVDGGTTGRVGGRSNITGGDRRADCERAKTRSEQCGRRPRSCCSL